MKNRAIFYHRINLCCMSVFLVLISLLQPRQSFARTAYSVTDFGARGDGATLATEAIQKAIDTAAQAGGGIVTFPAGKYLTGTLFLRSHLTLELQSGSVLLGSTRLEDYPVTYCNYPSYTDKYCLRAMIWGEDIENIAIVGRGTIDGQGASFLGLEATEDELNALERNKPDPERHTVQQGYANRPYGIRLIGCRDILIQGVTMQNSAMWMQHYLHCDRLTVKDIQVINHSNRNNDMIDIDSCRNVIVSDCYGDTLDDALTLKSTGPDPTENVVITNCILRSRVNAIKLGTESTGGFRNITISNCAILQTEFEDSTFPNSSKAEGYAGIALEAVDGGTLECITISNVSMMNIATPLFMRLGNRARIHRPNAPTPPVGVFKDVNVDNIVATNMGNICSSITGIPGHPIEGVSLSNIVIRCAGGIETDLTDLQVSEVEQKYPESTMFGELPAYGLYCRHVKGLSLANIRVGFERPDRRYALVCDDVENLTVDNFDPMVDSQTPAAALFRDVRNAFIQGCNPMPMDVFIRLRGACRDIRNAGNVFDAVARPLSSD